MKFVKTLSIFYIFSASIVCATLNANELFDAYVKDLQHAHHNAAHTLGSKQSHSVKSLINANKLLNAVFKRDTLHKSYAYGYAQQFFVEQLRNTFNNATIFGSISLINKLTTPLTEETLADNAENQILILTLKALDQESKELLLDTLAELNTQAQLIFDDAYTLSTWCELKPAEQKSWIKSFVDRWSRPALGCFINAHLPDMVKNGVKTSANAVFDGVNYMTPECIHTGIDTVSQEVHYAINSTLNTAQNFTPLLLQSGAGYLATGAGYLATGASYVPGGLLTALIGAIVNNAIIFPAQKRAFDAAQITSKMETFLKTLQLSIITIQAILLSCDNETVQTLAQELELPATVNATWESIAHIVKILDVIGTIDASLALAHAPVLHVLITQPCTSIEQTKQTLNVIAHVSNSNANNTFTWNETVHEATYQAKATENLMCACNILLSHTLGVMVPSHPELLATMPEVLAMNLLNFKKLTIMTGAHYTGNIKRECVGYVSYQA